MLNEVLKISSPSKGGRYIDCTFGGGGYSKEILKFTKTHVQAIDRDKKVLPIAKKLERKFPKRFKFYQKTFSQLDSISNDDVDTVIFDLGLSSIQLNDLNSDKETMDKHQKEMMDMINNMSQMTQDPNENVSPEMENLFNNGLISNIAKELTNELDLDKMDMGNPKNMNEAFGNLMGGNGNGNFFNLINKVGQKIQNKVETGQINQGDLIREAQQMMGGLKNPQQMAKAMNKKGKESTRDRLKRKLEERKAKEAGDTN